MSPESFAVLIVASDPAVRHSIGDSLKTTGFVLEVARSTQEAVNLVSEGPYDLALVDLNVADSGAVDACRRLRAHSPGIGIIVARNTGTPEDDDRVFEAGADDCIVAPFRFRELVARMGVVLRRTPRSCPVTPLIRAGSLELDLERRIFRRKGQDIHLSPREFDLLAVLMTNADSALTHERLARSAWGSGANRSRAFLRTYIKALRHKLEDNPAEPQYILTQPWVGYRFHNPDIPNLVLPEKFSLSGK
jgi:two-component system KDP operon response regulator KdpE